MATNKKPEISLLKKARVITLERPLQIAVTVAGDNYDKMYKKHIPNPAFMGLPMILGHVLEIPKGSEIWTDLKFPKNLEKLGLCSHEYDLNSEFPLFWIRPTPEQIYRVYAGQYGQDAFGGGMQSLKSTFEAIYGDELAERRRFNVDFPESWFPADHDTPTYDWPTWKWPDGTTIKYGKRR